MLSVGQTQACLPLAERPSAGEKSWLSAWRSKNRKAERKQTLFSGSIQEFLQQQSHMSLFLSHMGLILSTQVTSKLWPKKSASSALSRVKQTPWGVLDLPALVMLLVPGPVTLLLPLCPLATQDEPIALCSHAGRGLGTQILAVAFSYLRTSFPVPVLQLDIVGDRDFFICFLRPWFTQQLVRREGNGTTLWT